MLPCYVASASKPIPITPLTPNEFKPWVSQQSEFVQNWMKNEVFKADPSTRCFIKNSAGEIERVLLGIESQRDFWSFAALPLTLPNQIYFIDVNWPLENLERAVLGWGLGTYQFKRYKVVPAISAKLQVPSQCNLNLIENFLQSIFLVRDLINTPAEDMGPPELAAAAVGIAKTFNAEVRQIVGEDLLAENYPTIYTVGRASAKAPRLIDLQWGNPQHPKITLVGKGVCFDSGGLDLKSADGMLLMKKDMGGAAHALGLARLVMAMQLPIRLRVLLPIVENAVAGNAYRPLDIIKTRKGLTVEVINTDAEGRLILCDALAEAAREKPEIIIDFATLTGAARIALGPEIPALFSNNDQISQQLLDFANKQQDPIWRLPLYRPYRRYLDSLIADMTNATLNGQAGSITAALFLNEFVDQIPWVHFDFMAWNLETKLGRVQGGEAMAIRAVYTYLAATYSHF